MTRDVSRYLAPDFLSLTIGIVVYFVGVLTTQRVKFLQNFSIPEPVSGGFIAVAVISLIYFVFNLEIDFDLTTPIGCYFFRSPPSKLRARLAPTGSKQEVSTSNGWRVGVSPS